MGPSNRNREKSGAPFANRMDTVRSLLGTPPSPSTRSSALPPPTPAPPPHAEWSSPTFTRARARPSNLHSYLRSSSSFPLNQNHQHKAPSSAGGRSNASSGSGNGVAYPAQQSEWRSQRTQATQTLEQQQKQPRNRRATQQSSEQLSNNFNDGEGIQLGTFGAVGDMAIDTVDFLIRVLEDRKQELLVPRTVIAAESPVANHSKSSKQKKDTKPSRSARASSRRAASSSAEKKKKKKKKKSPFDEEQYTESSDESDNTLSPPSPSPSPLSSQTAAVPMAYPPPTTVVRSRSYEALVQLEGILEARHQQLMRDGILEPPVSASSANTTTGGVASIDSLLAENEDESEADAMLSGAHVMTDIQEEIRKMHCSLRRQRSVDNNYALDGNFESLFVSDARGAS